jgi:hypothetical protein
MLLETDHLMAQSRIPNSTSLRRRPSSGLRADHPSAENRRTPRASSGVLGKAPSSAHADGDSDRTSWGEPGGIISTQSGGRTAGLASPSAGAVPVAPVLSIARPALDIEDPC